MGGSLTGRRAEAATHSEGLSSGDMPTYRTLPDRESQRERERERNREKERKRKASCPRTAPCHRERESKREREEERASVRERGQLPPYKTLPHGQTVALPFDHRVGQTIALQITLHVKALRCRSNRYDASQTVTLQFAHKHSRVAPGGETQRSLCLRGEYALHPQP